MIGANDDTHANTSLAAWDYRAAYPQYRHQGSTGAWRDCPLADRNPMIEDRFGALFNVLLKCQTEDKSIYSGHNLSK
jgi:hypothetical protein